MENHSEREQTAGPAQSFAVVPAVAIGIAGPGVAEDLEISFCVAAGGASGVRCDSAAMPGLKKTISVTRDYTARQCTKVRRSSLRRFRHTYRFQLDLLAPGWLNSF